MENVLSTLLDLLITNIRPLLIFVGGLIILVIIKGKLSGNYTIKDYDRQDLRQYRKGASILTRPELTLYRVIRKHLNNDYIISPKVRLADFINVKSGSNEAGPKSTQGSFNRISGKHADFLVCDLQGKPKVWIELDDKSHNTKRARKADGFKNDLAKYVKIPLIRIKTGQDYNEAISAIANTHL